MDNEKFREEQEKVWNGWLIEGLIGEGSYGKVYKISRTDHGHKYFSAVKIISIPSKDQYREAVNTLGRDKDSLKDYFIDMVDEIIGEVNILYSLAGHSNILGYFDHKIIDHGDDVGWDVLIRMEYVKSLRKHLKEKQMTRGDVISLGIDICNALEVCSKKGIVHRDIKDENIFVNNEGIFKLGDFGIAKIAQDRSMASMRGTPLYMAPEIYKGIKYDARIDIYSLGLVLYKLLNDDRMPFLPEYPKPIRFRDNEKAIEKRMSGETMPLPSKAQGSLGKIVLKACDVNPNKRYNSARELREELQTVLNNMEERFKNEAITHTIDEDIENIPVADKTESIITNNNEKTEEISISEKQPDKTELISNKPVKKAASDKKSKQLSKRVIAAISAAGAILLAGIVIIVLWLTGVLFNNSAEKDNAQVTQGALTAEQQQLLQSLRSDQWVYSESSYRTKEVIGTSYENFVAFGADGIKFYDNMEMRDFSLVSGVAAFNTAKEYSIDNFDGKDYAVVFIEECDHYGKDYEVNANYYINEDGSLVEFIVFVDMDTDEAYLVSNYNIFIPLSEYDQDVSIQQDSEASQENETSQETEAPHYDNAQKQVFIDKLCGGKWTYHGSDPTNIDLTGTDYENITPDGIIVLSFEENGEGTASLKNEGFGDIVYSERFDYEIGFDETDSIFYAYIWLEDYEHNGVLYHVYTYFYFEQDELVEFVAFTDIETDEWFLVSNNNIYYKELEEWPQVLWSGDWYYVGTFNNTQELFESPVISGTKYEDITPIGRDVLTFDPDGTVYGISEDFDTGEVIWEGEYEYYFHETISELIYIIFGEYEFNGVIYEVYRDFWYGEGTIVELVYMRDTNTGEFYIASNHNRYSQDENFEATE